MSPKTVYIAIFAMLLLAMTAAVVIVEADSEFTAVEGRPPRLSYQRLRGDVWLERVDEENHTLRGDARLKRQVRRILTGKRDYIGLVMMFIAFVVGLTLLLTPDTFTSWAALLSTAAFGALTTSSGDDSDEQMRSRMWSLLEDSDTRDGKKPPSDDTEEVERWLIDGIIIEGSRKFNDGEPHRFSSIDGWTHMPAGAHIQYAGERAKGDKSRLVAMAIVVGSLNSDAKSTPGYAGFPLGPLGRGARINRVLRRALGEYRDGEEVSTQFILSESDRAMHQPTNLMDETVEALKPFIGTFGSILPTIIDTNDTTSEVSLVGPDVEPSNVGIHGTGVPDGQKALRPFLRNSPLQQVWTVLKGGLGWIFDKLSFSAGLIYIIEISEGNTGLTSILVLEEPVTPSMVAPGVPMIIYTTRQDQIGSQHMQSYLKKKAQVLALATLTPTNLPGVPVLYMDVANPANHEAAVIRAYIAARQVREPGWGPAIIDKGDRQGKIDDWDVTYGKGCTKAELPDRNSDNKLRSYRSLFLGDNIPVPEQIITDAVKMVGSSNPYISIIRGLIINSGKLVIGCGKNPSTNPIDITTLRKLARTIECWTTCTPGMAMSDSRAKQHNEMCIDAVKQIFHPAVQGAKSSEIPVISTTYRDVDYLDHPIPMMGVIIGTQPSVMLDGILGDDPSLGEPSLQHQSLRGSTDRKFTHPDHQEWKDLADELTSSDYGLFTAWGDALKIIGQHQWTDSGTVRTDGFSPNTTKKVNKQSSSEKSGSGGGGATFPGPTEDDYDDGTGY